MQDSSLFTVGFFSPSEPFIAQTWRPKDKSKEAVDRTKADKRFAKLIKAMQKGKPVDGLLLASVWMKDESTGGYIRSMTADGTEAPIRPGDVESFLMPVRPKC
jgi:hypothetical protein